MIHLEKAKNSFVKYVDTFDLTIPIIEYKKFHSFRVMENANMIARSLKLDKEKEELATLIGLLHDIGRFEEKTKYINKKDTKEVDHGYIGVKVLNKDNFIREFIEDNRYDKIIEIAVYHHNKLEIPKDLTDEEELYLKIVRDADKLDIMYESYTLEWESGSERFINGEISDLVFDEIKNHRLVNHNLKNRNVDRMVGYISYIFDIYFPISYKIIKENNYIENIANKFELKNEDTKNKMEQIVKISKEYVDQKI